MATYNFTVRAQDETGAFSDRDFSIQVRNNLVDRLFAIDDDDGYASVDGKTWERRTSRGGVWCRNFLGKWIVGKDGGNNSDHGTENYMISDDTINWTDNLQFKLSNQAPVEENGEVVEEAGELYDKNFYFHPSQVTEMNGKVIVPALVHLSGSTSDWRIAIVTSTDLEKWYVTNEDYEDRNNLLGVPDSDHLAGIGEISSSSTFYRKIHFGLSNIVMHDGKYTMMDNHGMNFYVSDDLETWEKIVPDNKNIVNDEFPTFISEMEKTTLELSGTDVREYWYKLKSINSVLWVFHCRAEARVRSSNTRRRATTLTFYTVDLKSLNIGNEINNSSNTTGSTRTGTETVRNTLRSSGVFSYDRNINYLNGYLIATSKNEHYSTRSLSNIDNVKDNDNDGFLNNVFIFDGKLYFVYDNDGVHYFFNDGEDDHYSTIKKVSQDSNGYPPSSVHTITGLE